MQISSRFTIAMHILTYIATAPAEEKVTSEILADSVQVNPVIIRNILSQLKGWPDRSQTRSRWRFDHQRLRATQLI